MSLSLIITAAGIGIMTTPHCVAMCACGLAKNHFAPNRNNQNAAHHAMQLVSPAVRFMGKRLWSYTFGGALVGGASQSLAQWVWPVLPITQTIAIMLHVALAGMALMWLLQSGGVFQPSQTSQTAIVNIQPIKTQAQNHTITFMSKAQANMPWLWGFMPCNALYAAYALAYLTGNWLGGAMLMFGFAFTSGIGLMLYHHIINWMNLKSAANHPRHQTATIQWLPLMQTIILLLGLLLHALAIQSWITLPKWFVALNMC